MVPFQSSVEASSNSTWRLNRRLPYEYRAWDRLRSAQSILVMCAKLLTLQFIGCAWSSAVLPILHRLSWFSVGVVVAMRLLTEREPALLVDGQMLLRIEYSPSPCHDHFRSLLRKRAGRY